MYNIDLITNPIHISQYIITNSDIKRIRTDARKEETIELTNFRNKAFDLNKSLYHVLDSGFKDLPFEPTDEFPYKNTFADLQKYLIEISKLEELSQIISRIEGQMKKIKNEWENNYLEVSNLLNKLNINGDDALTVYLVPNCLKAGRYYYGKYIEWGYRNDFNNYNTIYLWHEVVHHHLFKNNLCNNKDLNEVVTMIISDRYLYSKLNNENSNITISDSRKTSIPVNELNKILTLGAEHLVRKNGELSIEELVLFVQKQKI